MEYFFNQIKEIKKNENLDQAKQVPKILIRLSVGYLYGYYTDIQISKQVHDVYKRSK